MVRTISRAILQIAIATLLGCGCFSIALAAPQSDLTEKIDAYATTQFPWMVGVPEEDGKLLRRLSLDLRNVTPSQSELDAFLADASPNRWEQWVDRFQQDPLARERLVDWYDKTLMQRRPFQHTDRVAWRAYLRQSVDNRTPVDQLIRQVITSAWWNRSQRSEQRFFLDRGGDPHIIARDIGRVLFGRDMQCAQCHDNPQVDDYLQLDYHGILAFVSPSSLIEATTKDDKGADQKVQMYVEKAAGDAPFESVFDKGVKFRSATRIPGRTEQLEVYLAPDRRYEASPKPDSFAGVPAPPVTSRRELLAQQLNRDNRRFAENWANRIWAVLFGRGLVHPLDMHHSDNPPSHPQLLALVTDALIASNFDAERTINAIAKSRLYRRGRALMMDSMVDPDATLKLSAEERSQQVAAIQAMISQVRAHQAELAEKLTVAQTEWDASREVWRSIQQERTVLRAELDGVEASFQEANKKLAEAQAALNKASADEKNATVKAQLLQEAAEKLQLAKNAAEDAELQVALDAANKRLEHWKGTLPTLQQAVAAATTQRDTTASALETERTKWQSVVDKLKPVEERLQQADAVFVAKRAALESMRTESNWEIRRLAVLERNLKWYEASSVVETARIAWNAKSSQRLSLMQSADGMKPRLEEFTQGLATAQNALAAHDQQMATATNAVASLESHLTKLEATKTQLKDTEPLVVDPQAFASARSELERAVTTKLNELTVAKSNVAGMAQQRIALADSVNLAMNTLESVRGEQAKINAEVQTIERELSELQVAMNAQIERCMEARQAVLQDQQIDYSIAPDRSLSPEQFGWSILQATGVLSSYIANEGAELEKQSPLAPDASEDQKRTRQLQALRGAMDKLVGNVDVFSNLYASGVGQTSDEFFASPDQALYLANGGAVYSWAGQNGSNITSQLVAIQEPSQVADRLFHALMCRKPTDAERQVVVDLLSAAGDQRPAVVQEMVWGMLASAEFRLYP